MQTFNLTIQMLTVTHTNTIIFKKYLYIYLKKIIFKKQIIFNKPKPG